MSKASVERFRKFLVQETKCAVQGDKMNWPCGTCTIGYLNDLGLDSKAPEYSEENEEHDRHNEVWRAILQVRGDKGVFTPAVQKKRKKIFDAIVSKP